jgi:putative glycosyltransferase (TIGR04372 family)
MGWQKVRLVGVICWCIFVGNIWFTFRQVWASPLSWRAYLGYFRRLFTPIEILFQRGNRMVTLARFCEQMGVDLRKLTWHPHIAYLVSYTCQEKQQFEESLDILNEHQNNDPANALPLCGRGNALLQLGRYPEALADLTRAHRLRPEIARQYGCNLSRAFLHGLRGDTDDARQAMIDQMCPKERGDSDTTLATYLHKRLKDRIAALELRGSIGVFFSVCPAALGHSILDPFHYINLFRHRFDHLVMIHAPQEQYTPATALTLQILDQYVERIPCTDHDALNFSWQHLGELSHKQVTFLIYNYWALNRLAFAARSSDPGHPMCHGRDYLQLPYKLSRRGKELCRRNKIDLSRPIVVVHAREHSYHELRGQTYRNTDIRNYVPALRNLIRQGYQVVRIGDAKMVSVARDVSGLIEVRRLSEYNSVLDPYLISLCQFMISCQSGPCSYARVLGKPNLVVNGVYHYTLIPERLDLVAFKDYRDIRSKERLSVEQIFKLNAHLFDRTEHFTQANIEVVENTPEEIEAAVDEMLALLHHPSASETSAQACFRGWMRQFMDHPDLDHPLMTPMTDYIGYLLPECRLSDSVAQLRPGYLAPDQPNPGTTTRGLKVA